MYFIDFDLLLLSLRYHGQIKRKVSLNFERLYFTPVLTLIIWPSIKRWIILGFII